MRISECAAPPIDATALYIYTSGTTGLPKAAKVSHYRLMQWSHWFAGMMDTKPSDRMFNCLPLYHSVGGVVATFATLVGGGAVVIRPRFSASDFWRDVRDEGCTLFQYIGELCRYRSIRAAADRDRTLAAMACATVCGRRCGFPSRSAFESLGFSSTTPPPRKLSCIQLRRPAGAIGRIPPFLGNRLPVALLRFDIEKSEAWRNADRFPRPCATNEIGEAVGLMPGREGQRRDDSRATLIRGVGAQVLRNVFRKETCGIAGRFDAAG